MFNKSASVVKPLVLQFNGISIAAKSTPVMIKKAAYAFCCNSFAGLLFAINVSISLLVSPVASNAKIYDCVKQLYFLHNCNRLLGSPNVSMYCRLTALPALIKS